MANRLVHIKMNDIMAVFATFSKFLVSDTPRIKWRVLLR